MANEELKEEAKHPEPEVDQAADSVDQISDEDIANGNILSRLPMDEELWPGGPTRANVEEMKKKYPTSDVRASLLANETGIIWRTLNRAEWRDLNNIIRNIQDEGKKEEKLIQTIVLYPDLNAQGAIDALPAGVVPQITQDFYMYAGFTPVAESIKL